MADAWRHSPFIATPNRRHWRDVKKWRLALGLVAAPILPIALGGLVPIGLIDRSIVIAELLKAFAVVEAAAAAWSLVVGWIALALRARLTGQVGRIDCFLLGILLAFTLPFAVWIGGMAYDAAMSGWSGERAFFFGASDVKFSLLLGLILTPFGLLGGWIFWRVGIRPAAAPVVDVTGVFE